MLTDSGLAHDVYDQGPPWLPLTRIPLPHRPEAAPKARRHARDVLALRRVDSELIATVELAVSELVTNAVRHGICLCGCTRGPVSLTLLRTGGRLRVEVADPSRTPPRWPTGIESVDAEAEEGRGLLLVTALAADWGDQAGATRGKVVWCEFAPAAPAPRAPAAPAPRAATAPAPPAAAPTAPAR
ncbi:ATP-binding protein [Streptomyces scopuliridis]|uniref:ATP-binding protein n=1 Tax=Streptomyces scopuliridis TaxID=452529 RepID=A0ACD4ZJH9_9ACTN|nr:ATP-binding protein [Streptomyces scopuliridis]WSB98627.1 ATP-binding protein [Streptomyces scopuliridis]WSC07670.1 ATP-binding protein [Streptomyces scopuliridis]